MKSKILLVISIALLFIWVYKMDKKRVNNELKGQKEIKQFIRNPQLVNLYLNGQLIGGADTLIFDIMTLNDMKFNHSGPINEINVELKRKADSTASIVFYIGQDSYNQDKFWVKTYPHGYIGGFLSTRLHQYLIKNTRILNVKEY